MDKKRKCALLECNKTLPSKSSLRQIYCCDAHTSRANVRAHRARKAAKIPYVVTGVACPVDGRFFPVEMYGRRPGRPRKYDCEQCAQIARKIRDIMG